MRKIPSEASAHFNRQLLNDDIPLMKDILRITEDYAETVIVQVSVTNERQNRRPARALLAIDNGQDNNRLKIKCACCEQPHRLWKCTQFKQMNLEAKQELVRVRKLCFNCFSDQHTANQCSRSNCRNCGSRHHSWLCRNQLTLQSNGVEVHPQVHERI